MKTLHDLFPYQQRAIDFMFENDAALAMMPVGTGKTVCALTAVQDLLLNGTLARVLVVAPKRVARSTWPAEVKQWKHLVGLPIGVAADGSTVEREAVILDRGNRIVTINYEMLPWLLETFPRPEILFDGIIFDEISKMKAVGSKRFKAMRRHIKKFSWRLGLAATPASERLIDIFGPTYLLDLGTRFGRSMDGFKRAHFYAPDYGQHNWIPLPGHDELIYEQLQGLAFKVADEDMPELPELVINKVSVKMPTKVRKTYAILEKALAAEIGDDYIESANAAVNTGKLHQMCQGFLYNTPGPLGNFKINADGEPITIIKDLDMRPINIHEEKITALVDILEERAGAPTIVCYYFQEDLARLRKEIPEGRMLDTQKDEDDWNAGKVPVLFLHPASAGHGLNLQHSGCDSIIFYGLTWSRELFDQVIGRIHAGHRSTGRTHTFVHIIYVEDSLEDRAIMPRLELRDMNQRKLFEGVGAI